MMCRIGLPAVVRRRTAAASRVRGAQARLRGFSLLWLVVSASACVHVPAMTAGFPRSPCRQVEPPAAITWIGPAEGRDRALLERWCEAVGPPIIQPFPSSPSGPKDTLAIVVWNVRVGGGNVGQLIDELRAGALSGGEALDAFVLLLQETYRSGGGVPLHPPPGSRGPAAIFEHPRDGERRSVEDVARDQHLALFYVPSMRNAGVIDRQPAAEDRGNAILSSLPLSDPLAIELPFERQRRVAVAATVGGATKGGAPWQLLLVNAHLDTSLALTRGGPAAGRRRQGAALVDVLKGRPLPVVLGGDFNSWLGDGEPAVRDLRRFFDATPSGSLAATWDGPLGMRFLLDHVFVRGFSGAVTIRRLESRFGSDHHPLLATIDFRAGGTARRF